MAHLPISGKKTRSSQLQSMSLASFLYVLCTITWCTWSGEAQNQNLNNLDVLEPVVRISPDRGNRDYFGWTTIFHAVQQLTQSETMESATEKIRILVGAPYGSFPGGLPYIDVFQPHQSQTGLVYSCPVSPGNCEGVRGDVDSYINDEGRADNTGATSNIRNPRLPVNYSEGRLFDQAPNAFANAIGLTGSRSVQYDIKEGQLMGASLYSNGDIFIACAPRWKLVFTSRADGRSTRGMCYSSGRNLQNFTPRMVCTSAASNTAGNDGDLQCLSGHSAVVNNGHFVIGVPGYDRNIGLLASQPTSSDSTADFTIGDNEARDDNGNIINSTDSRRQDQYQGFRIVSAHILNSRTSGMPPNLVTSVPRAGINKDGRLNVYASPTTINTLIFTNATGTQIGEFFGYSLAADDLDKDGYDDVLVGAPMYTDFTPNPNKVERGIVYLFINSVGELTDSSRIIINGPSSLPGRARFGSSLAILGDVDRDGYLDFAVGAPYYRADSGSNTGAVFVYNGRADPNKIPNQTPFMITADTMAMNVDLGMNLNTFGFSLSSGHDVDANGYNDLLVGAYESQAVFLLRSLPVAEVSVSFVPHSTVNIDNVKTFELEVTASFNGLSVADRINVSFEVREVVQMTPRVFFNATRTVPPTVRGRGVFSFVSQGVNATASVTVYTKKDVGDFSPLIFNITLLEISRSVSGPVTGNETLRDLSSFPRLKQQGQTTTQVNIVNICGTDGCKSDVLFSNVSSSQIEVIANSPALSRVTVTVSNNGSEPAINMGIVITSIPDFVSTIKSVNDRFTSCERANSTLTCLFSQSRFDNGESVQATFEFGFDTESLTGNESESMITLRLSVPEVNQNEDINVTNNELMIAIQPTAQADISISAIVFTPSMHEYTAVAPTSMMLRTEGVDALDTEIILVVTVGNVGPSTIQNATLDVFFPSRLESIGTFTFLYPYDIRNGPVFTCNRSLLDPEGLQQVAGRGKRSAMTLTELRARRRLKWETTTNPDFHRRSKRQEKSSLDLDCTPGSPTSSNCTKFTCSITNLRRDNVTISYHSRIDERFFATLSEAGREPYTLRAYAAVRLDNDYITGDNLRDNNGMADVILEPFVPVVQEPDLLHVILWPVVGSILLLMVLVIILYCCGFFRRKKKPKEGEIEGDFTMPADGEVNWKSYSPGKVDAAVEGEEQL